MKKLYVITLILVIALVFFVGVVFSGAEPPVIPAEILEEARGVSTSNGVLDLPAGTYVGGNPSNYVTLTQGTFMLIDSGYEFFPVDTKVDCDPQPGYPDPCGLI